MKKQILLLIFAMLSLCISIPKAVKADANNICIKTTFKDKYIAEKLSRKKYDKNKDGYLSDSEIKKIKYIYLKSKKTLNLKGLSKLKNLKDITLKADKIKNLSELKKMPAITDLTIRVKKNNKLDLRKNKKLSTLDINMPDLQKLEFYSKNKIKKANIKVDILSNIDLSKCRYLKKLYIHGVKENKISINKIKNLKFLNIEENYNEKLNIKKCNKLEEIHIIRCNFVKKLAFKNFLKLKQLEVGYCKSLTSFNVENSPLLYRLVGYYNINVKKFSLNNLFALTYFSWENGGLTSVTIPENNKLKTFLIRKNDITNLDFSALKKVHCFYIDENKISGTLDLSVMPRLNDFSCNNNQISRLIAINHDYIESVNCTNNQLVLIDFRNSNGRPGHLDCRQNPNAEIYAYIDEDYYFWDSTAIIHDLF